MVAATRVKAAKMVRDLVANWPEFLVLDIETTGLGSNAETVQIAVVDQAGRVLLDTLVWADGPIEEGAMQVHGITPEKLAGAPVFSEVWPELIEALGGVNPTGMTNRFSPVWIYDVDFDVKVLRHAAGMRDYAFPAFNWRCAMKTYARFWGDWNKWRKDYRWHSLSAACAQQDIEIEEQAHGAVGDCLRTLALIHKMAAWTPEEDRHPF